MNDRFDATAALAVDGDALWQSLMDLGKIGATPKGGVARLALTDLDRQARDQFVAWCRAEGCSIRIDRIGNIFACRPGCNMDLPPISTGSHIDTQPTGGKFDGNFGVMAGLEVIRTLNRHHIQTEAPVQVCVWTNEEGSRFVPVMMGSGVYVGAFTLEHALTRKDADGLSVADELQRIGYAGSEPAFIGDGAPRFGAYFEAHIEQGPVLEDAHKTIGVVTGALGQRWYDVEVTGLEAHAGPTPMRLRKDALFAATHMMQEVVNIALARQPHGRGTVGCVYVSPNSRNVIPGKVTFTVDFRHIDDAGLADMDAALEAAGKDLEQRFPVQVKIDQVVYFPPVAFAPELVDAIRNGAERAGCSHMDIVSGAGHDAVYCAETCPTAMIFVPCKDGISHNEIEDADPAHLAAGANVLLHAVLARAGVAG